ncbi:AMP-binding protein [Cryptosporangium arvum]|uniref:Acyl-CoA synthetase (AMP-forming)/AMP-acid ligase II n=1 Tax=Cryptosporangium arvum DSM 44712 TaxID=927661 RepID=A0A010YPG8_9ACTN|nr:AMP-binding protein [Cryptosporangium arvum]EXG82090.1 acyl-CoA synthetase (AMP-forming)/AMP-acid ligase II [Cryptosporangium arvum DSM 44712]
MISPTWVSPVRWDEAEALVEPTPAELGRIAPDRLHVVDGDVRLDGAALLAAVAGAQHRLRAVGVGRGDVVGVQLPNWWEAVVVAHAVWGMGAVLCPVPVNYRGAELDRILAATPVAAFVVPARYRGVNHPALVGDVLERRGISAPVVEVRGASPFPGTGAAPELDAALDDVCVLMFTSGTTGTPKGVLHSHRTLLADAWSIARLFALDGDLVYMPSPVGHVTGLVYGVMMPLLVGGAVLLQAEWEAAVGADLIEEHGATFCVGATPFLRGLTDEYARRGTASALTGFACGGADIPAALVRRATDVLGAAVTRAYGLTEMPTVTCGGPDDPERVRFETDGRLTGSSQARLNDDGELEVRGPELCLGYLDPEHTRASFTDDGWFRTGDLARLGADGSVTITGRAKDIIVRGGENIGVKEIEDYLLDHPAIRDVAVVGVPDDVLGERACAFLVTAAPLTLAEIAEFLLARRIAKHKLPEYVLVVDGLPRTPSGKIQKFRLREQAVAELAAGRGERR